MSEPVQCPTAGQSNLNRLTPVSSEQFTVTEGPLYMVVIETLAHKETNQPPICGRSLSVWFISVFLLLLRCHSHHCF